MVRNHVLRIDPEAAALRRKRAESERAVTLRPADDCTARLSALLPIADGIRVMAALSAATTDDGRTRGQLMADTLVDLVIGGDRPTFRSPVAINLLVPVETLTDDQPAFLEEYGPVPADLARQVLADSGEKVRRVFTAPGRRDLIAMETRARRYPGLLDAFIRLRDQRCRTPHCGPPIRHIDHTQPHAHGGATSERNGQGSCEHCNYAKEHP